MYFITPQQLIRATLKKIGVLAAGQTPLVDDIEDAFFELNLMLAMWTQQRWLVYHLVTQSVVSTGAESYTIGPGGDINVPMRPARIESGFFRQTSIQPLSPDYPLELIIAREDYNRIRLKSMAAFPKFIFYDTAVPLGVIYPWPVPQGSIYTIYVSYKDILPSVRSTDQKLALPPEYYGALMYNLAVRLRPSYQLPPDPQLMALAEATLETIQTANLQIPSLQMPAPLISPGSGYNIYTDNN